jgi:hypothetical protein
VLGEEAQAVRDTAHLSRSAWGQRALGAVCAVRQILREEGMSALTPEVLANIREKAKAALEAHPQQWSVLRESHGPGAWIEPMGNTDYDGQIPIAVAEHAVAANPSVVLALLDRIEALESELKDRDDDLGFERSERSDE